MKAGCTTRLGAATAMAIAGAAYGGTKGHLATIYTFTGGADGGGPFAGLLAAPDGSFYGTTTNGAGTVFHLIPPVPGQTAWTLTTLYTFTGGADGSFPQTLVMDKAGALYGMTDTGGSFNGTCVQSGTDIGCGTAFRLAPPGPGGTAWQFSTIWTFSGGADGASPTGGFAPGMSGELYGITTGGFTCGLGVCGTVYRLDPPSSGSTAWSETTLYAFKGGKDGSFAGSYGPPILGPDGALYGVTGSGGDLSGACAPYGCGTVFRVATASGPRASWRKDTLLLLHGHDGFDPVGGVTMDRDGNLYVGANAGGRLLHCMPGGGLPDGCGSDVVLSPPKAGQSGWTETVLHRFSNGRDGGYPFGAPIRAGGRVFATTSGDEIASFGSLVEFVPDGSSWKTSVLFTFNGDANGVAPIGTPLWSHGVLYGTTYGAGIGAAPDGTIFAYIP